MPKEPSEILLELLKESPTWSVSVAESVTSGQVQRLIGAIPGIALVFKGGITTYTIDQKVRHLGVDPVHASSVDCVSTQVARQMATGVCCLFSTAIGISTTGFADERPKPFAHWAVCFNDHASLRIVKEGRIVAPRKLKSRLEIQDYFATSVLEAVADVLASLRRELKKSGK